jgi:hypothetical protein
MILRSRNGGGQDYMHIWFGFGFLLKLAAITVSNKFEHNRNTLKNILMSEEH